jgi:hypothetical protein
MIDHLAESESFGSSGKLSLFLGFLAFMTIWHGLFSLRTQLNLGGMPCRTGQ